jgi:predicted ATP-binding protein involved in virulence
MNPPPLNRPLQRFERDALTLVTSQGWIILTQALETEAGLTATFTQQNRRMFLLVASPFQEGSAAPRAAENLERSVQALAAALDLKAYDRVVFATEAVLPEPLLEALEAGAVEVWTRRTLRQLRDFRRSEGQDEKPAMLQISSLTLHGFRGIVQLELQDLPLNGPVVLIGPNGVGKSTLLDAMTMTLSWVAARLGGANRRGELPKLTDIHNDQSEAVAQVTVALGGVDVTWSIGRSRGEARRPHLAGLTQRLHDAGLLGASGAGRCLPVVAHYSVRRAAPHRLSLTEWSQRGGDTLTGEDIEGIRRGEAAAANAFFRWFREVEDVENELRLQQPRYRDVELGAARRAITAVMVGYTNLRIDRSADMMVLEKTIPGRSPILLRFDQLSDGEKTLLAMVGDLARLLGIRNPGLSDPLLGGGVVLIDEIDLHLHPGWQRVVVDRLQRTFPNIQFVLTTHSPQVISHVPTKSIVLIQQEAGHIRVERPSHGQGWDSNRILSHLMGVSERPDDVKQRIATIEALMDKQLLDKATELLFALEADLGRFDGEVTRLRAVLDFLRD